MDYPIFHRYIELAEEGKCKPLTCESCGNKVAVRAGKDDKPELQCFYCGTRTRPGLRRYEDILAVVKEHTK